MRKDLIKRTAGGQGSAGRVIKASLLFALVHSLLASRQAKDLTRQLAGERYRNGLYRFGFNVQSSIYVLGLAFWFFRLPDRELYRVRWPWAGLFYLAQALALWIGYRGVKVIGIAEFGGIPQLKAFLAGETPAPEPESQGPPLRLTGEMKNEGPFHFSRHPGNLAPIGLFLFMPRMTVNRAAMGSLAILYAVLGSIHEEYRLRRAYGPAYDRYRAQAPFMLGRPAQD